MTTAPIECPFTDMQPPAWASGWGQDQFGYYAEFSIRTGEKYWDFLTQRMRWIPPGTFTMGSPDDEADRSVDEVQHSVTLRCLGFRGQCCVLFPRGLLFELVG